MGGNDLRGTTKRSNGPWGLPMGGRCPLPREKERLISDTNQEGGFVI